MKTFEIRDDKSARFFSNEEGRGLMIMIDYDLGGCNYFNSQTIRRGYYLIVKTVSRIKIGNKVIMESNMMGGLKTCLETATRFNKNKLLELVKKCEGIKDEMIEDFNETYRTEVSDMKQECMYARLLKIADKTIA